MDKDGLDRPARAYKSSAYDDGGITCDIVVIVGLFEF